MASAFFWGLAASISLVLGCLIVFVWPIHKRALGLIMAFGSGMMISAVAYELVGEALDAVIGGASVAAGLFAGTLLFLVGDGLIDSMGGAKRKSAAGAQAQGSALAIVLGTVLDGIPESVVIGLGLVQSSANAAMIVAVFISNLPEAIAATSGLMAAGWRRRNLLALWGTVVLVCALSSLAGYAALADASPQTLAFVLSFAGGALLTMLADTMMPEAYEHGGMLVGAATTLGFAAALALSALE